LNIITILLGYLFLAAALIGEYVLLFTALSGRWAPKSRWLDFLVTIVVVGAGSIIGCVLLILGRF
jgi:hypothetical protein